jgi:hypothetical protein
MNRCDMCGVTLCAADERVYLVEMEVGPCAEAPEGYASECEMCERCYLRYHEGLGENPKEENP